MPAPGKAAHWLQRRDPKLYDRITDRLAEQLCFPPGTGRARRRDRIADARAALERLVSNGDAVAVDGRLLPPPRDGNRAERGRQPRGEGRQPRATPQTEPLDRLQSAVLAISTPTSTEEGGEGCWRFRLAPTHPHPSLPNLTQPLRAADGTIARAYSREALPTPLPGRPGA